MLAPILSRLIGCDVPKDCLCARMNWKRIALMIYAAVVIITVRVSAAENIPEICPMGYDFHSTGNKCYKLYTDTMIWDKARAHCLLGGSDLAVIKDEDTLSFINEFLAKHNASGTPVWLGLKEISVGPALVWVDGSSLGLLESTWLKYSNDHADAQDCVFMGARQLGDAPEWNDMACSNSFAYMCVKPASFHTACSSGYLFYLEEGKCVKLEKDRPLSWDDARAVCGQDGGDLVTIPNESYNDFIKQFAKGSGCDGRYWLGLRLINTMDPNQGHVFRWVKGSDVSYTDWGDNLPDYEGIDINALHNEDAGICTELHGQWNAWNDTPCALERCFICEHDYLEPMYCVEDDWIINNGDKRCYKKQTNASSFDDSRARCIEEDGDLATILDMQTKNFIDDNFVSPTTKQFRRYWIGMHNPKRDGSSHFEWVDGTVLGYTLPMLLYDERSQNCMTLHYRYFTDIRIYKYVYNDAGCDVEFPSICRANPSLSDHHPVFGCPGGFTFYVRADHTMCLMAETEALKTWSDAVSACEEMGAELLTLQPDDGSLISFLKKTLLVSNSRNLELYYWAKRLSCGIYSFAGIVGFQKQNCDQRHAYFCRHWGNVKHVTVDLGRLSGIIDEKFSILFEVVPEEYFRYVSVFEKVCPTLNLAEFEAEYKWTQSSSSTSSSFEIVVTNVDVSNILNGVYGSSTYTSVSPGCSIRATLTRPNYLPLSFFDQERPLQLVLSIPMEKIFCLCPRPETVVPETIQTLQNMTRPQNESDSPPNKLCPCRCDMKNIDFNPTPEVLARMLSRIRLELIVNRDELSSTINKKVSAKDDRVECKTMGVVGVLLCVIPACLLMALDLTRLFPAKDSNSISHSDT